MTKKSKYQKWTFLGKNTFLIDTPALLYRWFSRFLNCANGIPIAQNITYYDIGSTADCQTKYDLHLLIMMLGRFPIIYLSLLYISDSQDERSLSVTPWQILKISVVYLYLIFDISLFFSLQDSSTDYNAIIISCWQ